MIHRLTPLFASLLLSPLVGLATDGISYDYTYSPVLSPERDGSIVYTGSSNGQDGKFTPNQGTRPFTVGLPQGLLRIASGQEGETSAVSLAVFEASQPTIWSGWEEGRCSIVEIVARVESQVEGAPYVNGFRFVNKAVPIGYFFYIGEGFIGFGDDASGDKMTTYSMDTTTDFHTYRIVLGDLSANVYVDEGTTPVLTDAPRGTSAQARFEFGDLSATRGGGEILYQSIRWSNNLPLPSSPEAK